MSLDLTELPNDPADDVVSRRPWRATPEQEALDGPWSDYAAWQAWIQRETERHGPNGAFFDPGDDYEVAIGLYVVCCKLADAEYEMANVVPACNPEPSR